MAQYCWNRSPIPLGEGLVISLKRLPGLQAAIGLVLAAIVCLPQLDEGEELDTIFAEEASPWINHRYIKKHVTSGTRTPPFVLFTSPHVTPGQANELSRSSAPLLHLYHSDRSR